MGNKNGMYVIEAGDVISGSQATAFIKYDGKTVPCSWFTKLEAIVTKLKSDAPRLGTNSVMSRSHGWKGTGECEMYYASSLFRQLMSEYIEEGRDVYVDIVITNDDPSSTLGSQSVLLKNVNFNQISMVKFDIYSKDALKEKMEFTFDGCSLLKAFTHPAITE